MRSAGLDQLCAAACNTGAAGSAAPEIKVVEVDAFASVADLIHAAVLANAGAASLKEIYEVCEHHGRIAYRRAGGSRLITSNDHWKSQVRHALYTGERFDRVAPNSEYWQLHPAHADAPAELIKVLVRTDDPTVGVVAASPLLPAKARGSARAAVPAAAPKARPAPPPRRPSRPRRKRGQSGDEAAAEAAPAAQVSAEAFCDSVDPGATRLRASRAAVGHTCGPSDDHSTQEWEDKVRELPRLRATRASGRSAAAAAAPFATPTAGGSPSLAPRTLSRTVGQRGSGTHASLNSDDPSTLRWGSTGLRTAVPLAAESSLSAGRAPDDLPPAPPPRARATSAEADSPPFFPWFGLPAAAAPANTPRGGPAPRAKRRAMQPAGLAPLPTPPAAGDATAGATPLLMAQWGEAMRQLHAMMAAHHASAAGSHAAGASASPAPGWPPAAMPPPPMALLPYLLAGAAPFMGGQQAQHAQQLQQRMQAVMLGGDAAARAAPAAPSEPPRLSTCASLKSGAAQDKARRAGRPPGPPAPM